ncbi:hypothetical protein TPAR_01708 [Tolypocladium paradoxum]|uniref:Uncharacterized protein n=1 Tax=Tolypocladium paradoxum TaxID=94208 RepID=A0A2S4L6P7_9HYPO|nr:hypothetical protein TPAR_01708 [Tolypocladium paradoxum]
MYAICPCVAIRYLPQRPTVYVTAPFSPPALVRVRGTMSPKSAYPTSVNALLWTSERLHSLEIHLLMILSWFSPGDRAMVMGERMRRMLLHQPPCRSMSMRSTRLRLATNHDRHVCRAALKSRGQRSVNLHRARPPCTSLVSIQCQAPTLGTELILTIDTAAISRIITPNDPLHVRHPPRQRPDAVLAARHQRHDSHGPNGALLDGRSLRCRSRSLRRPGPGDAARDEDLRRRLDSSPQAREASGVGVGDGIND